jgi:chloramphenicol O-acetyltransferase type A
MKTRIDLEKYPRRGLYEAFKDRDIPCFSTTGNVDITGLKRFIDANGHGFFVTLSFFISKAANAVPQLRHRIIDGELFEFDRIDPSYTVLLDDDTFSFCDSRYFDNFAEYRRYAQTRIDAVRKCPDVSTGSKDHRLFITNIPWFTFTSFTHPYYKMYGCIPVITVGKYFGHGRRVLVPVGIQVNHAVADGLHVGRFYQYLTDMCGNPEAWLNGGGQ